MSHYQVDWVGAVAAAIAACISFLGARMFLRRSDGAAFYLVVALLTALLSVALRFSARQFGI